MTNRFRNVLLIAACALAIFILTTLLYLGDPRSLNKISSHEHFRKGGDMASYLAAMTRANIEKVVFVPTDWPSSNPASQENFAALLAMKRQYPDKIIAFATAYNKDPNAAYIIEEALKNGASGIKFIDWLYSEKYPNEPGDVDSENMYKVYALAQKYKAPVLLHIDSQKRPEWLVQFWKVAKDFPEVKFILAHYCRAASGKTPELELCARALDKFSNVFTDISMGGGIKRYMKYFDENPEIFRNFILRYQNRIMWGTDIEIDPKKPKDADWIEKRMRLDFLMLSRASYKNPLDTKDAQTHKGLNLPRGVLKKIYLENAKKILQL